MLKALVSLPNPELGPGLIAGEDFEHPMARRICCVWLESVAGKGSVKAEDRVPTLIGALSPEEAVMARALFMDEATAPDRAEALLKDLVEEVRIVKRYKELHALVIENQHSDRASDPQLFSEYQALLKRLSEKRLLNRVKTPTRQAQGVKSNG